MHLTKTLPLALIALLVGLAGCDTPSGESSTGAPSNTPANTASNEPANAPDAPKDDDAPTVGKTVHAVMTTSMGTIELDLNGEKAPITVANFVSYAKKGHYDGTLFHRVIPTFMIQGGGFDESMSEKPTDAPIKNEVSNGLLNERGTVAMARTPDPDSATSQFFINVEDNSSKLGPGGVDPTGYCVFGKVTKGMEVVDKIKGVPTASKGGHDDVPVDNVVIKSVKIVEAK
jgi:peptidyl-prolyl cis-trans isomerase B (cyclophilin B)